MGTDIFGIKWDFFILSSGSDMVIAFQPKEKTPKNQREEEPLTTGDIWHLILSTPFFFPTSLLMWN